MARRHHALAQRMGRMDAPGYRADTTPSIHSARRTKSTRLLPGDAILVSDVGVHHNWLLQFCRPKNFIP